MLNDVATVDDSVNALFEETCGTFENDSVGHFAAAADQHRHATGRLNDLMIEAHVVGRVGLDDVRPEFHGLTDEVHDFHHVSIDHVAAGLGIWRKDQRFDHHGNSVVITIDLQPENVIDALPGDVRRAGNLEKVHTDAGGIEPNRLERRLFDHRAETGLGQIFPVDVGGVGTKHQGGLETSWEALQMARLTDGQLNRIRSGIDESLDGLGHRLDPFEKSRLVEKTVIDGDIKEATRFRIEEAFQAVVFVHDGQTLEAPSTIRKQGFVRNRGAVLPACIGTLTASGFAIMFQILHLPHLAASVLTLAGIFLITSCSDSEEKSTPPTDSTVTEETSTAPEVPKTKPATPAPAFWSDVLLHRAIREGNVGYSGNGQFQINEQGQPEAVVLANCGVSNLDMLAGMPLLMIDLQGCPVSSLDALKGMPLVEVYLDKTNVEDLSPLAGNTTLKKLYLNESNVKDLTPLKGVPLEELNLVGCRVEEITPLAGMPLKMLWLTGLPVTDISPLATTPIQSLTLHRTQVSDLHPLATLSTLQRLHIGETPVKDLLPVSRLPLTRLVFTPANIEKGIDEVRKIPTMQQVGVEFEDNMQTLMSPFEFWEKFDKGEFGTEAKAAPKP